MTVVEEYLNAYERMPLTESEMAAWHKYDASRWPPEREKDPYPPTFVVNESGHEGDWTDVDEATALAIVSEHEDPAYCLEMLRATFGQVVLGQLNGNPVEIAWDPRY
jgi:hypothetical protein